MNDIPFTNADICETWNILNTSTKFCAIAVLLNKRIFNYFVHYLADSRYKSDYYTYSKH